MVKLNVLTDDDSYSNLSACERCVSEGGGCCTGSGSGIFVTLHDVMRISKATGLPLDSIAVFGVVGDSFAKGVQESDPFMFEAYEDGKVLQLIRKEGHCHFLVDGDGCQIFNDRPAICRIFPFSFGFRKDGTVKVEIPKANRRKDEDCTILQENFYRSNGKVFSAMNTSRGVMEKLCSRHVEELKEYKKYVSDIALGIPLEEVASKWDIFV
ncbi:hypothetical protein HOC01_00240 [archaeon]|jgi:Fe-S-cluster containining protein|nr:hypothetical protein [archaeon]MBT6698732.1 hypothetical protein [archaeon]